MNTPNPRPFRDDEIDALLARKYRDTTSEFEARWVTLKRGLRHAPQRRPLFSWGNWLVFAGSTTAALLAFALWRQEPPPVAAPERISPALAELFAMEAVLGRATALLDAENREALLHLPAKTPPPG